LLGQLAAPLKQNWGLLGIGFHESLVEFEDAGHSGRAVRPLRELLAFEVDCLRCSLLLVSRAWHKQF
jgi:hypothetical protein